MQGLIYVPLVIPDILMGVSLALLFNFTKVSTGMVTVLIAHVTFCISYTVIVIQSRLEGFDYSPGGSRAGSGRKAILHLLEDQVSPDDAGDNRCRAIGLHLIHR